MKVWIGTILMAILLQQPDAETRATDYLKANVKPGELVQWSYLLSNNKSADEQKVLQRLYNAALNLPTTIVAFQSRTGRIPTLQELSEQVDLRVPGEMDVMLRVVESDPRIPKFLTRNPATGEITRVNVEAIKGDPRFAQAIERSTTAWEGKAAPSFAMVSTAKQPVNSAQLREQPYLIYFWFTNCAPCAQTTPALVKLHTKYSPKGFQIVAATADNVLGLPYIEIARANSIRKSGIQFPIGYVTPVMQQTYGAWLFPSMFFVNRKGRIVKHLSFPQPEAALDAAIQEALR